MTMMHSRVSYLKKLCKAEYSDDDDNDSSACSAKMKKVSRKLFCPKCSTSRIVLRPGFGVEPDIDQMTLLVAKGAEFAPGGSRCFLTNHRNNSR